MSRKVKAPGKQKTRKSVMKRFKITATGKVMMRQHNIRHRKSHKSKKAIRSGKVPLQVSGAFAKKIKKMMLRG